MTRVADNILRLERRSSSWWDNRHSYRLLWVSMHFPSAKLPLAYGAQLHKRVCGQMVRRIRVLARYFSPAFSQGSLTDALSQPLAKSS